MRTGNWKKAANGFLLFILIFFLFSETSLASTSATNTKTSTEDTSTENISNVTICQVTFNANGGSGVSSRQVEYNKKVSKPKNPIRRNYKFEGWYLGNTKYNFNQTVTKNITLTARWSRVSVKKSYIRSVKNDRKGTLSVKFRKISKAERYQIEIATDNKFLRNKKIYTSTNTSTNIKNLIQGRTYYVRVRAYKLDSAGRKIYGKYSSKKKITISKGLKIIAPTGTSASISSCQLTSKNTVKITAKAGNIVRSIDDYYYLFSLPSYKKSIKKSATPLGSVRKSTSLSYRVSLNKDTSKSILQHKFVIAVKVSSESYKVISESRYITNPEKTAKYTYAFPKAKSKKGLQINMNYLNDAKALGVKNTAINIPINTIIAHSYEQNDTFGESFNYNGKTYWFSKLVLRNYDRTFKAMEEQNVVVSAILLLDYDSDLSYLITPGARELGHNYYALNTQNKKAREQLEATFTFLATRYSGKNGYGKIVNWILGNEVNNYSVWNYGGSTSLSKNAQMYADSFRLVSTAVKSVYKNARVYISLDHLWNTTVPGAFSSKNFLDAFVSALKKQGDIDFNIAYHPYPSPLTAPEFWQNTGRDLTTSIYSPVINMGNIHVLTNYVKRHYGSSTRIILSEQGFTSFKYGMNVEKTQAAAIAYAYYLTEFNSMIDSFILHRHIDHKIEMDQGLYLGLWTNKPNSYEEPDTKKYAWKVFKYMDTSSSEKYTKFALKIIGIYNWNSAVPNYNGSKFYRMN